MFLLPKALKKIWSSNAVKVCIFSALMYAIGTKMLLNALPPEVAGPVISTGWKCIAAIVVAVILKNGFEDGMEKLGKGGA